MEFKPWPKITRVENRRQPIFTEKLDGTNACIAISEDGEFMCQSRNQIITPHNDNYGFATWVYKNKEKLMLLGKGYHYGEWWGLGIGRGYEQKEKKFSMFNVARWSNQENPIPELVSCVPFLPVQTIEDAREFLKVNGSVAAPGYMRPEGAVMYDPDTKTCFKIIIDK